MKFHRFVYGSLAFWLVLALSVTPAIAGKPGPCLTVPANPVKCGGGGTCVVNVSETAGDTTVDQEYIIVFSTTRIEWATTSGSFTVQFGVPHPFSNTPSGKFTGTPGYNSGDKATIAHSSPPVCYQYSVEHCGGGHCATIDPKVIVTNVQDD